MPPIPGMLILKVKDIQTDRVDIDITEQAGPPVLFEPCLEASQVGNVPPQRLVALVLAPEIDSIMLD
jgi:hypothetical protein